MDSSAILQEIQSQIRAKQYRLSGHAEIEREADQITISEISQSLLSEQAEIIENYPDDRRGASCLILGFTLQKNPIHVVCGVAREIVIIITVYRPNADEWVDWRTRKEVRE